MPGLGYCHQLYWTYQCAMFALRAGSLYQCSSVLLGMLGSMVVCCIITGPRGIVRSAWTIVRDLRCLMGDLKVD